MAVDEAAQKEVFKAFVVRALRDARDRGMSDDAIQTATGVGKSTFHRWKREAWRTEKPELQKVEAFCAGLGIPTAVAAAALGFGERSASTTPEPTIEPDIRTILQMLQDPNVPENEKWLIRETLSSLARRDPRRISS
ncbi:XRE family transcriptional regulator [Catenuloplanes sp. NPDC051500]|uniref:XRE family transcriptional regulator n=1 Tax=Catenuloplanes sp. NPDC051500 TaxID=3363959 RepID=UPI0037A4E3C6